nr:hypothetical protein [Tanacetum cinerariifolium]
SGRGVVIGISRPLSRVVTGATVIITTAMDLTGVVAMTTTAATTTTTTTTTLAVTTGISVMDVTKETGVISPTDLPILVLSNPGVPLRVTPIQFALLVDVDTKESVVELQVLVSSVVKLDIYRRIAGRTPLRTHLVRLTRSQNTMLRLTVIPIELFLVTFMHLSISITVPYWESPCRSFQFYKHVRYYIMAVKVF